MEDDAAAGLVGGLLALFTGGFLLVMLACAVIMIASMWKVFTKAGQPDWAAIVQSDRTLQIVGRPLWWILLMLIPLVNFVIAILVYIDLAKSFGKSTGFGIGLVFLSFIFFPILGFGDARYIGPGGGQGEAALQAAS
jgi:hypothetical protein